MSKYILFLPNCEIFFSNAPKNDKIDPVREEPKKMFVTENDFLEYTGIDLNTELKGDSSAASRFLKRAESLFLNWCDANLGSRYWSWEDISNNPQCAESVRQAVLEQSLYMYRNGDLFSDSGYDPQRGSMISKDDLRRRAISDTAVDIMKSSGLFSHVLRNRRRYGNML